ncbi:MTH1187 family thiamine-binding protein [Heyndrickxia acidiproducens]|uniref:MTH1187 family thiamine-binding protein n=1 Tax=Heyndrickxia acidiproducens TaxID=1121084 RepID=UPI00036B221D|nr:MTH1187 family thiamine-binding protein [Heyndrickxia acidiproducens]
MEKSNQVTVSFSVVPHAKNDHLYSVVDRAIEVVQKSGVRYEVGAMETTMEGDLDELLAIIKEAQEACTKAGATEVITSIKIHYRPSTGVTIDEKIAKYRKPQPSPSHA